jgi:hypothetical protein
MYKKISDVDCSLDPQIDLPLALTTDMLQIQRLIQPQMVLNNWAQYFLYVHDPIGFGDFPSILGLQLEMSLFLLYDYSFDTSFVDKILGDP